VNYDHIRYNDGTFSGRTDAIGHGAVDYDHIRQYEGTFSGRTDAIGHGVVDLAQEDVLHEVGDEGLQTGRAGLALHGRLNLRDEVLQRLEDG
jgi:hypothetical protein